MAAYIVSAVLVGTVLHATYGCGITMNPIYSPEHTNVTFQFRLSPATGIVYRVGRTYNESFATILLIVYHDHVTETSTSISFIGDISTGNISFVYKNVNKSEAGVYELANIAGDDNFKPRCVSLFILGTPDVPTVVTNRIPDKGEDVVLTCGGSRSTTVPASHNLPMVYFWIVDNVTNPDEPRYKYTAYREQLTITNVQSTDIKKQITCRAKEGVSGGLSSANSAVISVQLYYGPEHITFEPANLSYDLDENSPFGPVSCTASCFPTCTYIWDKKDVGQASTNGTLYIIQITSNDAGTYTCTATNPGRVKRPQYTDTKQLNISVIYGPRNVALSPSESMYRQIEGFPMPNIQCASVCYVCTYSWRGPINYNGSQLSLGVLTRSHHGRYTCTAMNIKTKITQTTDVVVEVMYGPDNISFDPQKDKYEEVENTTLRFINCTASCYPACTYTWEKIEQSGQIGVDGVLNLGYIKPSMTGTYRCIAANPGRSDVPHSTATRNLTLHVIYGPDNITFDPLQDVYTGVENTLLRSISCTASCYPRCTYTWEKKDKTRHKGATNVLDLGYLNRSMAGIYTCTATNPGRVGSGSTVMREVSLHVIYGPDSAVISEGHFLIVTEGNTAADITCTSDCYPSCISSWISITGGSADTSGEGLSLGRVTRNQTDKYKCTISNTDPGYQRIADAILDITVHYAPDISAMVFSNTELKENNSAELKCNATGVPSKYKYVALTQTWGSVKIPHPRPLNSTKPSYSSLRFDALRLDDTGTYTCVVNNGVRDVAGILNQTSTIEILVQVSPKILAEEITFAGAISGNVMINVPFYSYPTAYSINFTRQDGIPMQNSNRTTVSYEISTVMTKFYGVDVTLNGSIAHLKITDIQETDFTNYILEVTNKIGRNRTVIHLITQSAPYKPTNFNRQIDDTYVVISWKAGFHGGNDQTFGIQLSKDKELWMNNSFVFGGKNTTGFQMNATLDTLSKGTQYYVRIYAFNIHGSSPYTDVLNFTTHGGEPVTQTSPNTGPIIGGVLGSAIILVVGTVVVMFLLRRRNGKPLGKKMSSNHQITQEELYTSMQYTTDNESKYLEINREQGRSSNGNQIPLEGPYTSMQYSADNDSEYLEINREHGQLQTGDKNVYVNLQLNPQQ